jgi:hypothetical protein
MHDTDLHNIEAHVMEHIKRGNTWKYQQQLGEEQYEE